MIGFVTFWVGLFMTIIGSSVARSTGRFNPGLIFGPILLLLSILCFYYSGKLERDEKIKRAEKAKKKEELRAQQAQAIKLEKNKEANVKQEEQRKPPEKRVNDEEAKSIYCAYCGAEMNPDQTYCGSCGTPKTKN